jgi:hypothetical protein
MRTNLQWTEMKLERYQGERHERQGKTAIADVDSLNVAH